MQWLVCGPGVGEGTVQFVKCGGMAWQGVEGVDKVAVMVGFDKNQTA